MSNKTDEQIAKDKAMIEAMKNARSNMDAAISRIQYLEGALANAAQVIELACKYLPDNLYVYGQDRGESIRAQIMKAAHVARKNL